MIAVRIPFFIRKILRAFAVDYKVALGIVVKPTDNVEQRGLSASGMAEYRNKFTVAERSADPAQSVDALVPEHIILLYISELEH